MIHYSKCRQVEYLTQNLRRLEKEERNKKRDGKFEDYLEFNSKELNRAQQQSLEIQLHIRSELVATLSNLKNWQ